MKRRTADYLKKQAAGEEVGQLVTLTGGSYRDLRKDGGKVRGRKTTAPQRKTTTPQLKQQAEIGTNPEASPQRLAGGTFSHSSKQLRRASLLTSCCRPPTHPLGRSVLARILSWSLVLIQYQQPPRLQGG